MPRPIARSKTRKSVAKRFKFTASGKAKMAKPGRRHLLECKAAGRKRKMGKTVLVHPTDMDRIRKAMPFSH
jgi:large subunit ribosomal protein L35